MEEHLLVSLAAVFVLGIGAQWIGWRFRLPSILLLLVFGLAAGPAAQYFYGAKFIDTDGLLGQLLVPAVSLSVALILFEGGLGLKLRELRRIGGVVRNLITIGTLITWLLAALGAYAFIGLDVSLSLLLGAIVVVTGPTVIGPLVRHVRPIGKTGSILNWEGILIDPVGAVLTLLVFDAILIGDVGEATTQTALSVLRVLVVGALIGLLGAGVIVLMLRRYWIPDALQNPVSVMIVVAVYTLSNVIQHESGLLSVIVTGVALANQRWVTVTHIIEFKENLRVLLLAGLFILLGARLNVSDLGYITLGCGVFIAFLMLVVRPIAVFLSTGRSELSFKEKVFLSSMAPRGIVAAAISSIFALRLETLENVPHAGSEQLVPITFLVIIVTVTIYGLAAGPLARMLGLTGPDPQGVLIVGAHSWARRIAQALQDESIPVVLIDTNWANVTAARLDGLTTYFGSALAEEISDKVDLNGIGRVFALSSNDAVNALACLQFSHQFDRSEVYQLAPRQEGGKRDESVSQNQRGRLLFGSHVTHADLAERFDRGDRVKVARLSDAYSFDDFKARYGEHVMPMVVISHGGQMTAYTSDNTPSARTGDSIVVLVESDRESGSVETAQAPEIPEAS